METPVRDYHQNNLLMERDPKATTARGTKQSIPTPLDSVQDPRCGTPLCNNKWKGRPFNACLAECLSSDDPNMKCNDGSIKKRFPAVSRAEDGDVTT